MVGKILLVVRNQPYGSGRAAEGLRMATAMIAMDVLPKIMFIDDGVYCLVKNQTPEAAGLTSFGERLKTLADLIGLYAVSSSMVKRNLQHSDLREEYDAKIISMDEAAKLTRDSEAVMTF